MNYSMIAAPLIGAVIGYATNYIAVKMMFRPRTQKHIGKFRVPFTPGIIPKGQPRLARAIGNVIGTSLLSKETLEETLLSEEMKSKLSVSLHKSFEKLKADERSVSSLLTTYIEQEKLDEYKTNTVNYIATRVDDHLTEHPVGGFIANEVVRTVKENLKGGIMSLMLNDSILVPITAKIQEGIDDYLVENTMNLIVPPITEECDRVLNKPIQTFGEFLSSHEEEVCDTLLKVYEDIVENHLQVVFDSLNIPAIVEAKINAMDVMELEELILSVMKKELNAIVNLGALIGFILGLFNLFF